jgi:hypothetical protein
LRRTGVGWLVAAAAAVVATVVMLGDGVSERAIPLIVVDDTVVRWISGLSLPGIHGIARVISYAASWWVIQIASWLIVVAPATRTTRSELRNGCGRLHHRASADLGRVGQPAVEDAAARHVRRSSRITPVSIGARRRWREGAHRGQSALPGGVTRSTRRAV